MERHDELLKFAGVVEKVVKAKLDKVAVQIKNCDRKQNLLESIVCKFRNVPPKDSRIV